MGEISEPKRQTESRAPQSFIHFLEIGSRLHHVTRKLRELEGMGTFSHQISLSRKSRKSTRKSRIRQRLSKDCDRNRKRPEIGDQLQTRRAKGAISEYLICVTTGKLLPPSTTL